MNTLKTLQKIITAAQQGRLNEAQVGCRALLKKSPGNLDAHRLLGMILNQQGQFAEAVQHLKLLLQAGVGDVDTLQDIADALTASGQFAEALDYYAKAVTLEPKRAELHFNLGFVTQRLALHLQSAGHYGDALKLRPSWADAHYSLGNVLRDLDRLVESEASYRGALQIKPDFADAHSNLGNVLRDLGRLEESEASFRRALQIKPDFADTHSNLGNVLRDLGRLEESEASFRRALQIKPDLADAHSNLGNVLRDLGRLVESEASYRRALQIKPDFAEGHSNLGNVLRDLGRLMESEASFRRALQIKPDFAEGHSNLGNTLRDLGRLEESEASCRRALQIKPDFAEGHCKLGNTLLDLGRLMESEASYRRALQIKPDFAEAHNNLGNTLSNLGRQVESEASYRRALQVKPDFAEAYGNLIFSLDFSESASVASCQAERKAWADRHAQLLYQNPVFLNSTNAQRPVRIGYVSADFREHSAARCFGSMLLHFDRQHYEVFAYSNSLIEDATTHRFKKSVTGWRSIVGKTDAMVVELIRRDQIDILVDLSGHSSGNRLLVFARKAAPVQITAWGHATGTGMRAMDIFFTDEVMVPLEEQRFYAEAIHYLPNALCYSTDGALPSVGPLPVLEKELFTFGSLNRLSKLTDPTVALWSRILQAVPESRLMLKFGGLDDERTRAHIEERFDQYGIGKERLELQGATSWDLHMAAYNRLDIVLDPFPMNGGVTTLEGLLMGVPVVALRGRTIAARVSASILTTLGLTDWIAESQEDYVQLAVSKSKQIQELSCLRGALRDRVKKSVLGDPKAYVTAVEAGYQKIWQEWCELHPAI